MDESWKMPWMIFIPGDHVAVQGFSWMMPGMIVQSDHVAVQGLSWMMPLDYYPRVPCCGTWIFMDGSWKMP